MDQLCFPPQQDRCRRGSLPLKKRRLSLPFFFDSTFSPATLAYTSSFSSSSSPPPPSRISLVGSSDSDSAMSFVYSSASPSSNPSSDERWAALALLSATTACESSRDNDNNTLNCLGKNRPPFRNAPLLPPLECQSKLEPRCPSDNSSNSNSLYTSLKARVFRRQNGLLERNEWTDLVPCPSSLLHNSSSSSSESEGCCFSIFINNPPSVAVTSDCEDFAPRSSWISEMPTPATPRHNQLDKRCTGAPHEVCCQATTTRGRPCTYVAVEGTLYCNLHAAITNSTSSSVLSPLITNTIAPLRDSSFKSPNITEALVEASTSAHASKIRRNPPKQLFLSSSMTSVSSSDSSASVAIQVPELQSPLGTKVYSKSALSRRRAKHADSPYPLLSKIPVDQWHGTTVKIAVGPMMDKMGVVDRWGNGWITVQIPKVGGHNRRSFELYVVSSNNERSAGNYDQHYNTVEECNNSLNEQQHHQQQQRHEEQHSLLRGGLPKLSSSTISSITSLSSRRLTVSPLPASECGLDAKITPCIDIFNKDAFSYDAEDTTAHRKMSLCESEASSVIMETPLQNRKPIDVFQSHPETNKLQIQIGELETNERKIVTPVSTKRVHSELPLSETLALAQEGGAKKYRIDMLFGTAALERSRRSVHNRSSTSDSKK